MKPLDTKLNDHFPGLVVRKDLVKIVKGNAIVPSYVLEYLLGQYCATPDEASIKTGIETVKEILRTHYVHRNEAGLVKSIIKEKGRHKVIDTGWKIVLDRGLDIFQHYDMNQAFSINNRLQQYRSCKAFEVTYLKSNDQNGKR